MHPVWIDIHTALEANREILASGPRLKPRWMKREVYVMSMIRDLLDSDPIHETAALCACFQKLAA